uniref:ST3 beta-galactoside alpha-2,3-sialyltransferase 1 n=1 Tax=Neogobius melanostomus TaxID=47308 RepID=A0A8C6T7X0_9GOBI
VTAACLFLRPFITFLLPFRSPVRNVVLGGLLQYERRDIKFFKQTTQKIFEVFPAYPPVPEPGLEGCRTCAVVGNSINLNKSHYGKLIDHHTFVFRINAGKTKGFEEDVGNRTTHRVMYPESATNLDNSTHLVLFPFKIRDLQWLVNAFTTDNNVMVVNPAFMRYVHQSWLKKKGQYPSTGFMVVILALHLCDEVRCRIKNSGPVEQLR